MNQRLLFAAIIAVAVAVIVVPIEYVAHEYGILSGAQAAAGWGIGLGIAAAFGLVYWWQTRSSR